MPPKKAKEKQLIGDQASEIILEYLRKQNRPYSIIEIVTNLHDVVSKTNAAKALKDLTERELIKEKISGKQAIYHITQESKDAATPEELKEMSTRVDNIRGEITAFRSQKKELEAELLALQSAPTASALRQTIKELEANIAVLSVRLASLRAGTVVPVSAVEKAKVDTDFAKYAKMLKTRRKMFKELWGLVTESGEQNKQELWERLGLEDDIDD